MSEFALRDMILPDIEAPLPSDGSGERRKSRRYERCLEGVLITEDGEHPVTCLDVAFAGVKVCTRDGFVPELGELAEIRITMGDNAFRDDCLVVDTTPGPDGTIIHLAM